METELLQFTSSGHILGFETDGIYLATGNHMLRESFANTQGRAPISGFPDVVNGQIVTLGTVTYPDLWPGITLVYDNPPGGILRSTYQVAPGAAPGQIALRYNVPPQIDSNGNLIFEFETGQMRASAPLAWQDIDGQRVFVEVAFQTSEVSETSEVSFSVSPYDPNYPLTIDPTLAWNTFLGGSGSDRGSDIAVDDSGNVYITGRSDATWGSPTRAYTADNDAYVAKLNSSGILQWHTFLGGTGSDSGVGIALDGSGNIYVAGTSSATWGSPIRLHSGSSDAYVAKLESSGTLLWNTFLGGAGGDDGADIALDGGGNIYVAGTSSATWGSPERNYTGGVDTFAAKLNSSGVLQWNTFLGGGDNDSGFAIAVDGSGNAHIGGQSECGSLVPWFDNAVDDCEGYSDNFAARLNSSGILQWNTFSGGPYFYYSCGPGTCNIECTSGTSMAVDVSGNVYVAGGSTPWGNPVNAHTGNTEVECLDAYVVKVNSSGVRQWHTFMGGSGSDSSSGIAVDGDGNIYVSGSSSAAWGSPERNYIGSNDAFAAKLNSNSGVRQWHTFLGGSSSDSSSGIAVDDSGNVYVAGRSSADWGSPERDFIGGGDDAFVAKINDIDLSATKTNTTAGAGTVGATFNWTVTVSNANTAIGSSAFADGQIILKDNLPAGPTYGAPTVDTSGGATGSIDCYIALSGSGQTLYCEADGNVTLAASDSFDVQFSVTPQSALDLTNPSGGVCQADPQGEEPETNEGNNACTPNPDTVTVTDGPEMDVQGNGASIPDGDASPAAADKTDFGNVDVVSGSVEHTFTIENTGTENLTLDGTPKVAISGHTVDFSVTAQPSTPVAPSGGSTTFKITFNPSVVGLREATVSIANNDSNEDPYTFDIQGTGTTAPEMDVQGKGVSIPDGDTTPEVNDDTDFGSANVTTGSVTHTFTIENTGSANLDLTGTPYVTVTAGDFSVTAQPTTDPVPAGGGTTTFEITFDPSAVGTRTATVSIANDDADENPYTFEIQGAGINAPTATTDAATGTSSSGATLNGTVNASNDSATVTFEYGTDTSYGTTVTADQSPVTGTTDTAVSKAITSLAPNTTYHYKVVADNTQSTTDGLDVQFTTNPAAPTATTEAASAVTATGATLNGTINAKNASSSVTFEYGLDTSYGTTSKATPHTVSGSTDTAVSLALSSLSTNTTYHYRVVAVNAGGTTYGADMTFTTGTAPEIDVQGNSISIPDGDTTPQTGDDTNFGDVLAASGSATHTFTIENSGNADLTLTLPFTFSGTHKDDFSVSADPALTTIPPSGSTTFDVQFDPSDTGLRQAEISITNTDGDENPYNFAIEGTGTAPEMDVKGNSVSIADDDITPDPNDHTDFGGADLSGGTVTRTFTVENTGNADLNLTDATKVQIRGTNAADFTLTIDASSPVAASGGTTTFAIKFDPNALGTRNATVSISNDDGDENTYNFSIQGTGASLPEMDVQGNDVTISDGDSSPSTGDHTNFGDVDAASGTVTRTFTIKNPGGDDLTLGGAPNRVEITGTHAADFTLDINAAATVSAGGETTFTITFDPGAVGARTAEISIDNDDSDENPYNFSIQGTGTTAAPEMDVIGNPSIPDGDTSPSTADQTDFGDVNVTGEIVVHTFTIRNTGSLPLNLTGDPRVTIGGTHAADFTLTADADVAVAAGGGESTFTISFDPSAEGLRQATVSIANDDSDENPYDFNIQGTGTVTPVVGGIGEGDGESGFKIGADGGVFVYGPVKVIFPQLSLTVIPAEGPSGGNTLRLGSDGRVFDVVVRDYTGKVVSEFDFPIAVCIKPNTTEIRAAGGNINLLNVYHNHAGGGWEVLDTFVDGDYVCSTVNRLSLFGLGVPMIPDTGFPPGVVIALKDQPAKQVYAEMSDFRLEIPALHLELPIVGVPLTARGWDVSWLGDQAGYLEGTAYPTWEGNTAITAHVWDRQNNPGPFIDLHTLRHGDKVQIQAWGQTYTYEVREVMQVRSDDLRALPHDDYDVLTLITCQGYNESSGEYDWRIAVRAVLIDVSPE